MAIAKKYLAIPGSFVQSEQLFPNAGELTSQKKETAKTRQCKHDLVFKQKLVFLSPYKN